MSIWSEDCLKEALKKFKRNILLNTESLKDFFDVATDVAYMKNKKFIASLLEVSKKNKSINKLFLDNSKTNDLKTVAAFLDKKISERRTFEKKQEEALKKKLK